MSGDHKSIPAPGIVQKITKTDLKEDNYRGCYQMMPGGGGYPGEERRVGVVGDQDPGHHGGGRQVAHCQDKVDYSLLKQNNHFIQFCIVLKEAFKL